MAMPPNTSTLLRLLNSFWIVGTIITVVLNLFAKREQIEEFVNEPTEALATAAAAAATATTVFKNSFNNAQVRQRRGE